MDTTRFDALTRRRFGLAAGGSSAMLLGLLSGRSVDAGKNRRKRKKRCKNLGDTCQQGGKRKCCGELRCDHHGVNSLNQTFCCKKLGRPCTDPNDCCSPATCNAGTCQQIM